MIIEDFTADTERLRATTEALNGFARACVTADDFLRAAVRADSLAHAWLDLVKREHEAISQLHAESEHRRELVQMYVSAAGFPMACRLAAQAYRMGAARLEAEALALGGAA